MNSVRLHHKLVTNLAAEKKACAALTTLITQVASDKKIIDCGKKHSEILNTILHLNVSKLESFHLKSEFFVTLVKREYGEGTLMQEALEALTSNLKKLKDSVPG